MKRERERERERESYWYGEVGCELCPCGKNPESTKLTITRLIQRYRVTGRIADRTRSGRPRVTTDNEDRHLRILHLCNRFLTVTSSAVTGLGRVISRHTERRRLRQHGIRAYRPFRGMTLTRQNQLQRLIWVSFNVGNIGTGNVYSFLMRAGSSYSELMAGLGYTYVQEREHLCAVFRRLYHLVVDL